MQNISEHNRLRYAGRIPQETLDYLSAKKKADGRIRLWEVPILAMAVTSLFFLMALLFRSEVPTALRHSLPIIIPAFLLASFLLRRIQRFTA